MDSAKHSWMRVQDNLKSCWQQLLFAHLAFTALGVVIFTPLVAFTGRLLLRLSGQPALADQDIAYFLLSPLGFVALILFAALLIGILAFEQAALMRIAISVMHGQRTGTVNALRHTAAHFSRMILFAGRLVARVLALTLPFLALAAVIAYVLITDYDINYYLAKKPPEFLGAVVLIVVVLVVMMVLLVRKLLAWSLALPLMLFAGVTPAQSFAESTRITRGNRKLIISGLMIWAGIAIILGIVVLGAINLIGAWTVPLFSNSLTVLIVVLGGLSMLWMLANFVITTYTSGSFAFLIMEFYEQTGQSVDTGAIDSSVQDSAVKRLHLTPVKITAALVIAVVISGITGAWLVQGIQTIDEVIIVAHRGAAGKAPENTMASIRQAIEDKTDWVEIDVQETADGKVVVVHDSDFMKLSGNSIKVWDATLAQLGDIDVGSWFAEEFSSERVPTLQQVLELCRGRANLVIELKYYGHDEQLEQRVVDIVEQAGMVDSTAIMSLKYDAVKKVRSLRPEWKLGLLSATAIGDLSNLDADFLAVASGMASAGFIRRAHEAGKQVFVWTINDPVSMSRMISLGVDGLITDEPEMARQVMDERAKLSSLERLLIQTALVFGVAYSPEKYRDNSP